MVICIAGGGTLGHIFPAVSIINTLVQEKDVRVIFIATRKDEKYTILQNNPQIDRTYYIDAQGLSRNLLTNIKTCYKTIKAYQKIKVILKKEKVDIVIGMGGYISGIAILAGNHLNLKTIIHEQNSVFGLANKLVLKKVDLILLTFPIKMRQALLTKSHLVGNPRMNDAMNLEPSLFKDSYNLLITSGSLGSKVINDLAVAFLQTDYAKKFNTTVITGSKYYEETKKALVDYNYHHFEILPFTNDLLKLLDRSGIVLSRSGSTTTFEIIGSTCVPIFIPSPNVTNNHQYLNAKYIYDRGIGEILSEDKKEILLDQFIQTLKKIEVDYIEYIDRIKEYQKSVKNEKIVELIMSIK